MSIKAQGQFTIIDMNDPIVSGSEPKDKVVGMLWLDTSKNPNELKRWDGENWITVSDPNIKEDLKQTIIRVQNAETKLHPDKITAVVEANTTVLTSKDYVKENYTTKEYAINNLANKSELEVLNNKINANTARSFICIFLVNLRSFLVLFPFANYFTYSSGTSEYCLT